MDSGQQDVARVALTAAEGFGFVLAGGNAISAHGIGNRPSEDIDLFTNRTDPEKFDDAVRAVVAALEAERWSIETVASAVCFAQIVVARGGESVAVDLGVDYRTRPPATMSIGPVLALDDAAANKLATLYSRGYPRDYMDVDSLLTSGAFTLNQLLELGDSIEVNPLDRRMLAARFTGAANIPDREFERYGMSADAATALRKRFAKRASLVIAPQDRSDPRPTTAE